MNADPDVMHDLGGPISREQSDAKFDRYVAAFNKRGFCRWVVESPEGNFLLRWRYAFEHRASPRIPL
jgi:hypothetical protein